MAGECEASVHNFCCKIVGLLSGLAPLGMYHQRGRREDKPYPKALSCFPGLVANLRWQR